MNKAEVLILGVLAITIIRERDPPSDPALQLVATFERVPDAPRLLLAAHPHSDQPDSGDQRDNAEDW